MAIHPLSLALVALVPAGATWWTGRRVVRRLDDPALPDLLMRRRGRMNALGALALVAIVGLDEGQAAWAVPLMVGATMAAAFPAQRVLLDERWGLGAYLWHSTRRLAGGLAFWIALLLAPSIVMGARDPRAAQALTALLAVGLVLWLFNARRIWLWTHAATPLGPDPALDARFAAVMARSTTARPRLYRFGQPGERRAAAFALPGTGGRGAVIFSDALLELLTPEETAAVFAHEVAHLEHYTTRRMRRMRFAAAVLVVAVLALSLLARRTAPGTHLGYTLVCSLVVILALGARARRSRGHETASDLRGAELCGDAEALVRALTKLHAALRLPRRWSAEFERTATHPSLAHRISALRGETTTPAAASAAVATSRPTRRRRARWLAVPAAVVVLVAIVPPLARSLLDTGAAAPDIAWRDAPARVVSSAALSAMVRDLVVAPGGARYVLRVFPAYAARSEGDDEREGDEGAPFHFLLGTLGDAAAPRPVRGHAAAFVGDDTLLVLADRGDGEPASALPALELRLSAIVAGRGASDSAGEPTWRLALPAVLAPELHLDAASRRWSVTGRAVGAPRTVTSFEGRLGDTAIVRHEWTPPTGGAAGGEPDAGYAAVTPLGGGVALAARMHGDSRATLPLVLLGVSPWKTELSILGDRGGAPRRVADLRGIARCVASDVASGGRAVAACTLMTARGASRLVVVDRAGDVETLASFARPVTALALSSDGRIALAAAGERDVMLLDPGTHTGTRVALPAEVLTATGVAWTGKGEVVVMGFGKRGSQIVRIGLPSAMPRARTFPSRS